MTAEKRGARILVLGDDAAEVSEIGQRLAAEFSQVETNVDVASRAADAGRFAPDVLVLAFASVAHADACASELTGAVRRSASVVLCDLVDAAACADLCRQGRIDDYVVVRPGQQDPHRLSVTVGNAARLRTAAPLGATVAKPKRPRVLAVEDDPFAAKILVTALRAEGIDVDIAGDASAAKAKLRDSHPAAILMDINLPGTDGLTLTEYLKSNPALAHVPVIMVTGDARRDVIERSVALGAAGFIVKPFTRAALMAKLEPYVR